MRISIDPVPLVLGIYARVGGCRTARGAAGH